MADESPALDRLLELGRRQGFVTVDQITQTLPIGSMSEVEIARAVERLEAAGIQVEIDDEWVDRKRRPDETLDIPNLRADEGAEPVVARTAPSPRRDETTRPLERATEGPALAGPPPGTSRTAWLPMLAGGIAVVVLVVLILGWLG